MAKNAVNPLNVHEVRRVDFCPPYFETTLITHTFHLEKLLDDWIYENTTCRYYIGKALDTSVDISFKQKLKVGFENPSELSFFMLACPFLKYNT